MGYVIARTRPELAMTDILYRFAGGGVPPARSPAVVRIILELPASIASLDGMYRPSATPGAGTDAAPIPFQLTSDRSPSDLVPAVDAWVGELRARARSPLTLRAFREVVMAGIRAKGWQSVSDVCYDAVIGYLGQMAEERKWKSGTYNRNLCAFRSFTRFLEASDRVQKDPLRMCSNRRIGGERGARAADADEARSLVRMAWIRQQADRRCTCNRALYWYLLFACGMRVKEPAKLRWEHMKIDEPIPFIAWTDDVQKNRRRTDVVITMEAARLLRAHRDTVLHGNEMAVFPSAPTRESFRNDRERLGIDGVDVRGYRFSPHTARKSFETWLVSAGVHDRMIRHLMRHAVDTDDRYHDPPLEQQAAAVQHVPRLWTVDNPVDNSPVKCVALTRRPTDGTISNSATPTPVNNSVRLPRPVGDAGVALSLPARRGGPTELVAAECAGAQICGPGLDSGHWYEVENAEGRTRTANLSVMNAPL